MHTSTVKISYHEWGQHQEQPVYLFKIENETGAYVTLTNYGATLVAVTVPNAQGVLGNVVLGFQSLQAYVDDCCYLGSTVGRFANRIGGARFKVGDTTYQLENNDGRNTNHGGYSGFNSRVFDYKITSDGLSFSILSKDGEGGYPGNLDFTVRYQWTNQNELIMSYEATTDKQTVANFTNHAYFNLSNNNSSIFDHSLTINAAKVLESDAEYIPTGIIKPAGSIGFANTVIRSRMIIKDAGIAGLNDCYLLNTEGGAPAKPAAELLEKNSGRKLEVFTSYPAIMLYTGDYLQSGYPGHHFAPYRPFDGLCLECQYYPDSPNHPNFPTTVLEPGDTYQETIIYKFSCV